MGETGGTGEGLQFQTDDLERPLRGEDAQVNDMQEPTEFWKKGIPVEKHLPRK